MSIGGRASEGTSFSEDRTRSSGINYAFGQSGSFVDPTQQPFLEGLRQRAFGTFDTSQPDMTSLTGDLSGAGQQAINSLTQLGNPQQVIDAQLTGLRSGLNDIQNQGLQRIGDQAIASGAFGGSRQGVAEGVLGGEIAKAYTQGYGDIIANANNQAINANNAALAGGGQLINTMLQGNFGGLEALAGILGNPTILSQSTDTRFGADQTARDAYSRSNDESAGFEFGFK